MKSGKILFLMIWFTMVNQDSQAQVDPHTSQYYMNPLMINPANAGAFDGSVRISTAHRNQWRSVSDAFSTTSVSADFNTNKKIAFGFNVLNHVEGDAGYNFLTAAVSVAYTGIQFGKENFHRISLGIQTGLLNRRIDPTKFRLGDQWNSQNGYSPTNPTADIFTTTRSMAFDASAGILYYNANPEAKSNLYLGISTFHISKPTDPFLGYGEKGVLPIRYVIHGGLSYSISNSVMVVPNFLYMKQGSADEKMFGMYFQISQSESLDLLLGSNIRMNDAVMPFAGFTYNNFTCGLSYDVNISTLGKSVNGTDAFELSLSYKINKGVQKNLDYLKCPRM